MKFELFKEMVKENISSKMGNNYEVELVDVTKNNQTKLTGVVIKVPGETITPTIYLDGYYEMFKQSEISIHQVASRVIEVYNNSEKSIDFDSKQFMNYEWVKKHLIFKVVNTEQNREMLQDVPHINYLDLSMIFQVVVTMEDVDDHALITVTNQHQKIWDVDIDELVFTAKKNMQKIFPSRIKTLHSMLTELINLENDIDITLPEIYVVTNSKKLNGATAIMYKELLRNFSVQLGGSYYILPSSIHELILLPDDGYIEPYNLKDMVSTINDSEVETEEILSYSVYYYNRNTDVLSVCV